MNIIALHVAKTNKNKNIRLFVWYKNTNYASECLNLIGLGARMDTLFMREIVRLKWNSVLLIYNEKTFFSYLLHMRHCCQWHTRSLNSWCCTRRCMTSPTAPGCLFPVWQLRARHSVGWNGPDQAHSSNIIIWEATKHKHKCVNPWKMVCIIHCICLTFQRQLKQVYELYWK